MNVLGSLLPLLAALAQGSGAPRQASTLESRTWVRSFGLDGVDDLFAAAPRNDGGLFLTGQTTSFGSGGIDAWVLRLDRLGRTVFEVALDGASYSATQAVLATPDGGCLVLGATTSFGAGGFDGWTAKLDASGAIQWQKAYGSDDDEVLSYLAPSPDGYYLGGTITPGLSVYDIWLLEIDFGGNVLWQWRFSIPGSDFIAGIAPTDTGLAVVAYTSSSFPGSPGSLSVARPWLLALDGDGGNLWQKVYDAGGGTNVWSSIQTLDDGFVVAGDVRRAGRPDVWVVRLDANGDIVWDRRIGDPFGLPDTDRGAAVRATAGGSFEVFAWREVFSDRLWLLELDAAGTRLRDRTFDVRPNETARYLELLSNGDLLLGAVSTFETNALVMRFTPDGRGPADCALGNLTAPTEWSGPVTVVPVLLAPVPFAAVATDTNATSVPALTGKVLCPR